MTDVHLPQLDDDEPHDGAHTPRPGNPWKWLLKIGLEVALITTGVFLGLAGEQWRENIRHRELAHESLLRFRAEFRENRAQVMRVHDTHVKREREMRAYLTANIRALMEHLADPRKPLPQPVPIT